MPFITGPVGAGGEEPVQNREEDRSFHLKAELSAPEEMPKNGVNPQFLPEPPENKTRPYLLCLGLDVASFGQTV